MPHILAAFFQFSGPAFWMSAAGLAVLVIGLMAAKNEIAQARGLNRIVALTRGEFRLRNRCPRGFPLVPSLII